MEESAFLRRIHFLIIYSRKNHVRRTAGERFNAKYNISTVKHPPNQMKWGAMSANGTAGIYFLKPYTTMNGAKYSELLRDKLPTHMSIDKSLIFMHDGAPCHRSKIVKKFLQKITSRSRLAW